MKNESRFIWMNLAIGVLLFAAFIALTLYFQNRTPPQRQINHVPQDVAERVSAPLPAFSFETTDGRAFNTADMAGTRLIINFWASWCAPCIVEFPHLLELARTHSDNVTLILISNDSSTDEITRFVNDLDVSLRPVFAQDNVLMVWDEDKRITQGIFQTFKLPETILVNEDGQMLTKLIGADWKPDQVRAILSLQ